MTNTSFMEDKQETSLTKSEVKEVVGEFLWSFGASWFIESKMGNFIWDDPDHGGNNTVRETLIPYLVWLDGEHIEFARSKGLHCIKDYIGEFELVVEGE